MIPKFRHLKRLDKSEWQRTLIENRIDRLTKIRNVKNAPMVILLLESEHLLSSFYDSERHMIMYLAWDLFRYWFGGRIDRWREGWRRYVRLQTTTEIRREMYGVDEDEVEADLARALEEEEIIIDC